MVSQLFFYQLVLIALVWLCVMLQWAWPSDPAAACPTTLEPLPPLPKRHRAPTPFAGLTTKPHCDACEQAPEHVPQPPGCPPPRIAPRVAARARWTRHRIFARSPPVPIGAGWGWAISVPMGIRTVALGGNGTAPPVTATSRRPMAPRCMASAWRPKSWCGRWARWRRTSYHLSTPICQFFTPSALPAHNESGWHHSTYDDAAWPSGYAGVGRQYCVRPAHAAAPSPAKPHTRC